MSTNCRRCDASVPEEAAFCSRCGAVIGAELDAQPGGVDGSWDIPATFIGQKHPPMHSQPESTNADSSAPLMPDTKHTPQVLPEE